jgi:hypothetical protein
MPFFAFSLLGVIALLVFSLGSAVTSGYSGRAGEFPWPDAPTANSEYGQVITAENSIGTVALFGDSHMQRQRLSLSEQATQFGLDFADGTRSGCPFFEGITELDSGNCTADFQDERLAWTARIGPSFVIVGGRFPLAIEGSLFDNMEGGVEVGPLWNWLPRGATAPNSANQEALVQDSLKQTIRSLLGQGHIVVLVYPIPEVGWDVTSELKQRAALAQHRTMFGFPTPLWIRERLLPGPNSWPVDAPVTTSYDVYVERAQSTFDALDAIRSDRIIRIYPHKIFCDEREGGRCVTHDDHNIFYSDDSHLSDAGARLVTGEIMKEISQWDPKP